MAQPDVLQQERRFPPGNKEFLTTRIDDNRGKLGRLCGVLTPSQSAVFGQYSPMRNGQGWKYAFKWPGKGDGDGDKRTMIYGTRRKHVAGYHPGRTTLTPSGNRLRYRISQAKSDVIFQACTDDTSNPKRGTDVHFDGSGKLIVQSRVNTRDETTLEEIGGMDEGINAVEQAKIDADNSLAVGELYLIGEKVYRCIDRDTAGNRETDEDPYETEGNMDVYYEFEPETEYFKQFNVSESQTVYTYDQDDVFDETHVPIQKIAIGSIGTTREVNMVEIGFKSTVYRQINGYPNIAQFTYKEIADDFAKEQQSWQPERFSGTTTAFHCSVWRCENPAATGGTSAATTYSQFTAAAHKLGTTNSGWSSPERSSGSSALSLSAGT